jgi:hypothetical protein
VKWHTRVRDPPFTGPRRPVTLEGHPEAVRGERVARQWMERDQRLAPWTGLQLSVLHEDLEVARPPAEKPAEKICCSTRAKAIVGCKNR